MKLEPNFEIVKIVDDYVLIPLGAKMESFNGTVVLNEVSAFLLEKMQEDITETELVGLVTEEFDVDHITAKNDVHEALNEMMKLGVIHE